MIPAPIRQAVLNEIKARFGEKETILGTQSIGGGCIHHAMRLQTPTGNWFLKYNHATEFDNFEAEKAGLEALQNSQSLKVPAYLAHGKAGDFAWLLIEYIHPGTPKKDFWETFAQGLAQQHGQKQPYFGFPTNNFIGKLPQYNSPTPNGVEFFIQQRLAPQLQLARKNGWVDAGFASEYEAIYEQIAKNWPEEWPCLLHGDLWSGNFMIETTGEAVIFDPAVYYGNREAELAFTRLFGGFNQRFYDAYQEASPLANGWQDRIDIWNLYPLMVHLNLFGRSYLPQIRSILKPYS